MKTKEIAVHRDRVVRNQLPLRALNYKCQRRRRRTEGNVRGIYACYLKHEEEEDRLMH